MSASSSAVRKVESMEAVLTTPSMVDSFAPPTDPLSTHRPNGSFLRVASHHNSTDAGSDSGALHGSSLSRHAAGTPPTASGTHVSPTSDVDSWRSPLTMQDGAGPTFVVSPAPMPSTGTPTRASGSGGSKDLWSHLLCRPEVYDPYVEAAPMDRSLTFVPDNAQGTGADGEGAAAAEEEEEQTDGAAAEASLEDDIAKANKETCVVPLLTNVTPTSSPNAREPAGGSVAGADTSTTGSASVVEGEAGASLRASFAESPHGHAGTPPSPSPSDSFCSTSSSSLSADEQDDEESVTSSSALQSPSAVSPTSLGVPRVHVRNAFYVYDTRIASELNPSYRPGLVEESDEDEDPYSEAARARGRDIAAKRWRRMEQRKVAVKRVREQRLAVKAMFLTALSTSPSTAASPVNATEGSTAPPSTTGTAGTTSSAGSVASSQAGGLTHSQTSRRSNKNDSFVDDEHIDNTTGIGQVYEKMHLYTNKRDGTQHRAAHGLKGRLLPAEPVAPTVAQDCSRESVWKSISPTAQEALLKHPANIGSPHFPAVVAPLSSRAFPPRPRYPLGSRAYVERVVLARRPQQVFALMALLSESHRNAWKYYLRLVQMYFYYINPILAAAAASADSSTTTGETASVESPPAAPGTESVAKAAGASTGACACAADDDAARVERPPLEASLVSFGSGSLSIYHDLLRAFATDYQFLKCSFDDPWRQLIVCVKFYLGLSERESAKREPPRTDGFPRADPLDSPAASPTGECEDYASVLSPVTRAAVQAAGGTGAGPSSEEDFASPPSSSVLGLRGCKKAPGTVCYAATLLHSMELSERYRPLQMAVHDAEGWLRAFYAGTLEDAPAEVLGEPENDSIFGLSALGSFASCPNPSMVTVAPGMLENDSLAAMAENPPTDIPDPLAMHTPTATEQAACVYVPMHWAAAQDSSARNAVAWTRRQEKLAVLQKAERALQRHIRRRKRLQASMAAVEAMRAQAEADAAATTTGETSPTARSTAPTAAGSPLVLARQMTATMVAKDDHAASPSAQSSPATSQGETKPVTPNESAEVVKAAPPAPAAKAHAANAPEAHRLINVGCFGLSFRSLFD